MRFEFLNERTYKVKLKSVITYLLIAAIISQNMAYFSYWLVFKCNQNNLAKTVCINKSKPEKKCRACCFLEKKINENEKQKSKDSNFKSNKYDWLDLFEYFRFDILEFNGNYYTFIVLTKKLEFIQMMDKPPCFKIEFIETKF